MYFPVIRNNSNNWLDCAFNDLFDMVSMPRTAAATAPAVNVRESDDAFTMDIAAPGLKKEHCTVNINNEGNLVVKIQNRSENEEHSDQEGQKFHYLRREFSYSNYEQTYSLPETVDKDRISAKVQDGILSVELPKLTPEQEKKMDRTIEIA